MPARDERHGILPTPERLKQGEIEQFQHAIADDEGRPSRPARTIDILAALYRNNKITGEMRQAGEDFRNTFDRANLDPLQCSDVSRPIVNRRPKPSAILANRVENARESVHRAVNAVGGFRSDAGNLVINVIGWGWSLKQWSAERTRTTRPISQHEASGVLRAALGMLAAHYGGK